MAATCPYLQDPETLQHIHQKVTRLIRPGRCYGYDRDDLHQHFLWAVQRAWQKYDHSRQSWYPFLRMILAREAASLIRMWRSQKRQGMVPAGSWSDLEESGRIRHRHCQSLEERDRIQLRIDIIKLVARLPFRLREVAEQLPEHSISSLARKLERDRSTIRSRLRQLRRLFEKAHLQDYLDPSVHNGKA